MIIISVALPVPIAKTFDYILPKNILLPVIGSRVLVPFNKNFKIGIITNISNYSQINLNKLKFIKKVIDKYSLFSKKLWNMILWSIDYYHYPIGKALFHIIPILLRKGKPAKILPLLQWVITEKGYKINIKYINKFFKQKQALIALRKGPVFCKTVSKLLLNNSVFKTLNKKKLCKLSYKSIDKISDWKSKIKINNNKIKLNDEQINAINNIINKKDKFITWLLAGVTGSGKTEVYLKVLEKILIKGHQALVLVPEINLTPQTITRFKKHFDVPIEIVHSGISPQQKLTIWLKAKYGACAIIIGTRSALFTPFLKLGIIIIDEEHDSSYKENKGWRYNARDLSVIRAKNENIPIILGTATPSLETIYNVQKKKYFQLNLNKRAGKAKKAKQYLLNIKGLNLKNGLSSILLKKINEQLKINNQVILFLNRRGFAPVLLCHDCGWIAECKLCDHYYTLHFNKNKLCCHYCNNYLVNPKKCFQCKSINLIPIGLGTEQLEIILKSLFPKIPVTRIDRDTINTKGSLENYLNKIKKGGAHILIGTQMLSKGHHFPDVTLVTLLNVDDALLSGDFRAPERFAQLYTQVAGRSGRSEKPGEVILQTHYPKHPILKILIKKGYMNLAYKMLKERQQSELPPFTKHVLIRAKDNDNYHAKKFLDKINKIFSNNTFFDKKFYILGPMPSLKPKCDGRFRWQLLLSHTSRLKLKRLISLNLPLINNLSEINKTQWSLDVDPIES